MWIIYLDACVRLPDHDVDQVHILRVNGMEKTAALELKRTRLLPYCADVTTNVVWNVIKLGVVSDERCTMRWRSEDILKLEGFVTHQLEGGGNVEIRSRRVMKRVATSSSSSKR